MTMRDSPSFDTRAMSVEYLSIISCVLSTMNQC